MAFLSNIVPLYYTVLFVIVITSFTVSQRPLTNYYQYSLGILTLCLSGVRVNPHVSNKLIHAVEHGLIMHGDSLCIGKYDPTALRYSMSTFL